MYSCKGDTVLDPFLGTGTTTLAAATCERNSIGLEIDNNFNDIILNRVNNLQSESLNIAKTRIENHLSFIKNYIEKKEEPGIRIIYTIFESSGFFMGRGLIYHNKTG